MKDRPAEGAVGDGEFDSVVMDLDRDVDGGGVRVDGIDDEFADNQFAVIDDVRPCGCQRARNGSQGELACRAS